MVTFTQVLIVASQSNIMAETQETRVKEQNSHFMKVDVSIGEHLTLNSRVMLPCFFLCLCCFFFD